jgi:co-chaperonin GroES (HSP10)
MVKPDERKRNIGLIRLPDSIESRVMTGVVQRVGTGRTYIDGPYYPVEVKVGERVAFLTAVRDAGVFRDIYRKFEDQFLIGERDILFVIEGDDIPEVT